MLSSQWNDVAVIIIPRNAAFVTNGSVNAESVNYHQSSRTFVSKVRQNGSAEGGAFCWDSGNAVWGQCVGAPEKLLFLLFCAAVGGARGERKKQGITCPPGRVPLQPRSRAGRP